jgi:hypothetical protein
MRTRSQPDACPTCEKLGCTLTFRDATSGSVSQPGQDNGNALTIPTSETDVPPEKANVQAAWKPVPILGAELAQVGVSGHRIACVIGWRRDFCAHVTKLSLTLGPKALSTLVIPKRKSAKCTGAYCTRTTNQSNRDPRERITPIEATDGQLLSPRFERVQSSGSLFKAA